MEKLDRTEKAYKALTVGASLCPDVSLVLLYPGMCLPHILRFEVLHACAMQVQMSDPDIASNATEFQKVARAAAEMEDQVSAYDKYKATQAALKDAKELLRESDGTYRLDSVYALGVARPFNVAIHAR